MRSFSKNRQILLGILSILMIAPPILAHEIKVSGDVAALIHIAPDDHPLARVPSKAWFALSKIGGKSIPLSHCDCHLAVYVIPHQKGKTPPLFRPILKSIDVESYHGVASALITFPKAGLYELELTGKALSGEGFPPFKLSYEVTVSNH